MSVPIPPPHPDIFTDGILHPELWLWDSWVMREGGVLTLYCLALSRVTGDGTPIPTDSFNDHSFHYRRFTSEDDGKSWTDRGAVLRPGNVADGSDAANVWSGSVLPLPDGGVLFGYTGMSHAAPDRRFVQSVIFATGEANGPEHFPSAAQSHPARDRDAIVALGYYLPEAELIGHNDGEADGPILAWRDPFLFRTSDGTLHAFWSAKVAPRVPAVAHAIVESDGDNLSITMQPPIRLPDEADYPQAEVPKICYSEAAGEFFLMISACSRVHEAQPDDEIWKELRLYRSSDIRGPWAPAYANGATIPDVEHLFGASFDSRVVPGREVTLISPYTAKADGTKPMSFAAPVRIRLGD